MALMKKLLGTLIIFIVVAVGLAFAAINPQPVELHYYVDKVSAPLSMVVVLALIAGTCLGVLASLGMLLRQRSVLARQRRKLVNYEREIKNLRQIPIKGSR